MIGSLGYFPPERLAADVNACPGVPAAAQTLAAWLFVGGSCAYTAGAALTLAVVAWLTFGDEPAAAAAAPSLELGGGGALGAEAAAAPDEADEPESLIGGSQE